MAERAALVFDGKERFGAVGELTLLFVFRGSDGDTRS